METYLSSSTLIISILTLCLSFFAAKILNFIWFRPKKLEKLLTKQGLQGNPYRLPLGDLTDLISLCKQQQPTPIQISDDPMAHSLPYYHHHRIKYGEKAFIWFGPRPRVTIMNPGLLKDILANPDVFQKPKPDPIGETVVGGLLYLEGEIWDMHRKIIAPAFHIEKLKNMVPIIGLSCSRMIDKWESFFSCGEESRVIDVWPDLQGLTGDVISRTAFGSSHDDGRRIFELQQELVQLTLEVMIMNFIPGWRYVPTKVNRRMKETSKEIHSLLRGIINQREKAIEKGETIGEDLLSTLMESNMKEIEEHGHQKSMVGMSIDDVIEECKLFYFAGSETTSSVLVWTMVMLSIGISTQLVP